MALNNERKTDIAFKKLINKDFTDDSKQWYEEYDGGGFNVHFDNVWVDEIPETPPSSSTDVVEVYTDLVLTEDTSVSGHRAWKAMSGSTQLRDWIPPKYGQGYTVKIYEDDGTGNKGDQIFTTDDSNWFFDYETGVLTFQNNHSFNLPIHLEGYRYVGKKSGVTRISKAGETPLSGEVTISEGTGISITQSGNNIEIAKDPEADIRVRDSSGTPTFVGYASGNESVPVRTKSGEFVTVTASDLDVRDLDYNSDSVTSYQGGSWSVSVSNTVNVQASDLDIRDLSASNDSVTMFANTEKDGSGTSLIPVVDSDGHLQVDVVSGGGGGGVQYTEGDTDASFTGTIALAEKSGDTAFPLQLDSSGNLKVNVVAGGAGGGVAQLQVRDSSNDWKDVGYYTGNLNVPVEVENTVTVSDGGGSLTVDAVNLDIRDLNYSDDSVTVYQGGSWSVSVSNTVTVTATDLDVRDLDYSSDSVTVYQGGSWSVSAGITSDGVGLAKEHVSANDYHSVRISNGTSFIDPRDRNWIISETVKVSDGGNSLTIDNENIDKFQFNTSNDLKVTLDGEVITVTASDFDVRDLSYSTDSVSAYQGGSWTVDRSWSLDYNSDSVKAYGSGGVLQQIGVSAEVLGTAKGLITSDTLHVWDSSSFKRVKGFPSGYSDSLLLGVSVRDSSGNELDPRARTWNLSSSSDTVKVEIDKSNYLIGTQLTSSGDVISAPGSGSKIKIYEVSANNENTNSDVIIQIREGSTGTVLRRWFLIRQGGGDVWRSVRGYELPENTSLYLEIVSGASPKVNINVEYEIVSA